MSLLNVGVAPATNVNKEVRTANFIYPLPALQGTRLIEHPTGGPEAFAGILPARTASSALRRSCCVAEARCLPKLSTWLSIRPKYFNSPFGLNAAASGV